VEFRRPSSLQPHSRAAAERLILTMNCARAGIVGSINYSYLRVRSVGESEAPVEFLNGISRLLLVGTARAQWLAA